MSEGERLAVFDLDGRGEEGRVVTVSFPFSSTRDWLVLLLRAGRSL